MLRLEGEAVGSLKSPISMRSSDIDLDLLIFRLLDDEPLRLDWCGPELDFDLEIFLRSELRLSDTSFSSSSPFSLSDTSLSASSFSTGIFNDEFLRLDWSRPELDLEIFLRSELRLPDDEPLRLE